MRRRERRSGEAPICQKTHTISGPFFRDDVHPLFLIKTNETARSSHFLASLHPSAGRSRAAFSPLLRFCWPFRPGHYTHLLLLVVPGDHQVMFLKQRLERAILYELLKVIRQYEKAKPAQSLIRALLIFLRCRPAGRGSSFQPLHFRRTFCH